MYMIYLDRHLLYLPFVLSRNPQEDLPGIFRDFACHDLLSILRDPYNVVLNIIYSVFRSSYWAHTPILYLFLFLPSSFVRIHPGSKLPGILRCTNKKLIQDIQLLRTSIITLSQTHQDQFEERRLNLPYKLELKPYQYAIIRETTHSSS